MEPKLTLQRRRIIEDERLRLEAARLLDLYDSHEESVRAEEAAAWGLRFAWHMAGHERAEP